jgi:hypothetical protein
MDGPLKVGIWEDHDCQQTLLKLTLGPIGLNQ